MKTGNVILAIFLWLCIPLSFGIGFLFGVFGGGPMCIIGPPLLFFILGLIALLTGMEKKHQPPPLQPVAIQQPTNDARNKNYHNVTEMKETGGREFMFNRNDLIFGMTFIGAGIIVFMFALWMEPLANEIESSQWLFLATRIIGL
ncbi:MAG: hypothetical protein NTX92_09515, partial [Euryarchaeota archaeon]|nr:hypothetical protein [Euryarchaeota archaeon]